IRRKGQSAAGYSAEIARHRDAIRARNCGRPWGRGFVVKRGAELNRLLIHNTVARASFEAAAAAASASKFRHLSCTPDCKAGRGLATGVKLCRGTGRGAGAE